MENKKHFFRNVDDLLQNEDFIKWRLFQTIEMDQYWSELIKEDPRLDKIIQQAIKQFGDVRINHYPITDSEKKELFKRINTKITRSKKRKLIIHSTSIAAVLLIGFFSILFLRETKKNITIEAVEDIIIGQTLPEEDIYLLTNGEKIELTDKSHIGLKSNGKAIITDSSHTTKELMLASADLNKLVVPYGKRTNLTLSDGTEVWLNSGTQLDFPAEFKGETREVFVAGEIFINVVTENSKPFIVHAGNMNVNVTGTAFNITAYKDEISKTVVLVNGKVNIETTNNYKADLIPNEKIVITEESVTREFVEVSEYISWKDGLLEFNSTPMSEVLKKIGRYYNVQFEKTDEVTLNDKALSGKLFLSNNLDSVMTSISKISSTEYLRKENIITISKN